MNRRRWTDADDAVIVATIKQPAVEVAAQLERTVWAVEKRRSLLFAGGVLTERGRPRLHRRNTWTEAEDALVIATIVLSPQEATAPIPSHTRAAIIARRRDLRKRGLIPPSNRRHKAQDGGAC